jgi:hypothetical protein
MTVDHIGISRGRHVCAEDRRSSHCVRGRSGWTLPACRYHVRIIQGGEVQEPALRNAWSTSMAEQ